MSGFVKKMLRDGYSKADILSMIEDEIESEEEVEVLLNDEMNGRFDLSAEFMEWLDSKNTNECYENDDGIWLKRDFNGVIDFSSSNKENRVQLASALRKWTESINMSIHHTLEKATVHPHCSLFIDTVKKSANWYIMNDNGLERICIKTEEGDEDERNSYLEEVIRNDDGSYSEVYFFPGTKDARK